MNNIIPLTAVPINTAVFIYTIKDCHNSERLTELGFNINTKIIPLHKNIGNSITAYFVKGAVIAIRNKDAQNIYVNSEAISYD